MTEEINQPIPKDYNHIVEATRLSGFTMSSDLLTCSLLRTLATSKPSGKFLELGTGTGLSTTWILDGMDKDSTLVSVDNDPTVLSIARNFLCDDSRLELQETDAGNWITYNKDRRFDYIFADTWHGKYLLLEDALSMLLPGGFYIIDDMLPQPNWPTGHDEKARKLVGQLENRTDLFITKQAWATGIIVAIKKS